MCYIVLSYFKGQRFCKQFSSNVWTVWCKKPDFSNLVLDDITDLLRGLTTLLLSGSNSTWTISYQEFLKIIAELSNFLRVLYFFGQLAALYCIFFSWSMSPFYCSSCKKEKQVCSRTYLRINNLFSTASKADIAKIVWLRHQ